jgi:hypothetical protein
MIRRWLKFTTEQKVVMGTNLMMSSLWLVIGMHEIWKWYEGSRCN